MTKAEGQVMQKVLRMDICTPYTSVHMPSIPALALCIVWHNLSIILQDMFTILQDSNKIIHIFQLIILKFYQHVWIHAES